MLAPETTTTVFESVEAWRTCSSSLQIYADLLSLLFLIRRMERKITRKNVN